MGTETLSICLYMYVPISVTHDIYHILRNAKAAEIYIKKIPNNKTIHKAAMR